MIINKEQLIAELLSLTEQATIAVTEFKNLDIDKLNFKKTAEQWSILECVEHLNLYGDFYLPEMQKQLLDSINLEDSKVFKPGMMGDYFVGLIKIKNGKIKKMKSPKDKNPVNSTLSITTLDRFLKQEQLLQSILQQASTTDLTKIKTAISLSKFIKLRLGDTLRFYVYHIERHVKQAKKVIG